MFFHIKYIMFTKFNFTINYISPCNWQHSTCFGFYHAGIGADIREDAPIKTLYHEFGHHLVYEGLLSLKGNQFVRDYFKQVPKDWLKTYNRWEREEEMVVECFALWCLDKPQEAEMFLQQL